MEEGNGFMAQVNKIKALESHLTIVDKPMIKEDIVLILLMNHLKSYNYLIVALESIDMKELTMNYITSKLVHKVTKKKEKELQSDNLALFLRQDKDGNCY